MTMFREVENKGLPCHLFGYILDAEEQNGFYDSLDIYFSALGDGTAEKMCIRDSWKTELCMILWILHRGAAS